MPIRTFSRTILASTSVLALAFAATILVSSPASAATTWVDDEAELVYAISVANSNPDADTITLLAPFTLTADIPAITESLTIVGADLTINGAGFKAFTIRGATANISTTFTNVSVKDATWGIDAVDSNVTITGSAFDNAPVMVSGNGITVDITNSSFDNAVANSGLALDPSLESVVTITGISAENNSDVGMLFESEDSTTTITDSSADENDHSGIEAYLDDGSVLTLGSVNADYNGESGIDVFASNDSTVAIRSSSVVGNGDEGMEISTRTGASAEVSDSTATDNDNDGFDFDSDDTGSAITITNSTANGQGSSGFEFDTDGGTVTASDLTANDNDDSGLDIDAEYSGSVTVSGMTATANGYAGAEIITEHSGSATVRDSTFADTYNGYGVEVETNYTGFVTLERLSVIGNQAGGIDLHDDDDDKSHDSVITITDSTIADNSGSGLEIDATDSTAVSVQGTTISGNSSDEGSGIRAELHDESSLAIVNSTISGNNHVAGGTLFVEGDGTPTSLTIAHSTITNNHAADAAETGGVEIEDTSYSIAHSIIAGNTAAGVASDLRFAADTPPTGSVEYSLIHNSAGAAQTAVDGGIGNVANTGAMLGALADNGGSTLTHLPLAGSPVIDAGNPAITGAPATDQRGQTRIVGIIDLGALEVKAAQLAATGSSIPLPLLATGLALMIGGLMLIVVRYRHAY